jgi:FixJ family two-component response regulator
MKSFAHREIAANGSVEMHESAVGTGARDSKPKPFSENILHGVIRKALRLRAKQIARTQTL